MPPKDVHRDCAFWVNYVRLFFEMMSQFVRTEEHSAIGSADAIVETAGTIYIFEFKLPESAAAEAALKQIADKGYALKYSTDRRKLVKIGVEFDAQKRTIGRWKWNKRGKLFFFQTCSATSDAFHAGDADCMDAALQGAETALQFWQHSRVYGARCFQLCKLADGD